MTTRLGHTRAQRALVATLLSVFLAGVISPPTSAVAETHVPRIAPGTGTDVDHHVLAPNGVHQAGAHTDGHEQNATDESRAGKIPGTPSHALPNERIEAIKRDIAGIIRSNWRVDARSIDAADSIVVIHIKTALDGSVISIDIANEHNSDSEHKYFYDYARAARRAVLLSSPLPIPPWAHDTFKEFTMNFYPDGLHEIEK